MKRDDCRAHYHPVRDRPVYLGRPADEEYWDDRWVEGIAAGDGKRPNRYVVQEAEHRLPLGSKVVDGGCGLAHSVYSLQKAGLQGSGADFAAKTFAAVNRVASELKVTVAIVRSMPALQTG